MTETTIAELAIQEREWRKCSKSFSYWVDTYCMMWTKEGGDPIPFKLWEFQFDAAKRMQHEKKLAILKARQMGLSWLASAYALWKVMFVKNFHAYYTSIGLKEVQEQMERIRFLYNNLPAWMCVRVSMGGKELKNNDQLIEFSNGSALHATASGKSAGHGSAPGLFICDEWARVENAVEKWRAIKPSLGQKSQVFMLSTSNGINTHFTEIFMDGKAGSNGFVSLFYSAQQHPDYTEEFLEEAKNDFGGDLQGYMQAYPRTPEDAFQSASRSIFPHDLISSWKEYIRTNNIYPTIGFVGLEEDRVEQGKYTAVNGRVFIEDQMGHFQMWSEPELGHRYTVGADVATGIVGGDWSVAVVFDTSTREVVAMYRAKISPEEYSYPLENIARYYNNAWLVVEVNTASELIMSDLKAVYPWLYRRQQRERITDLPTMIPGFYTSNTSKPRIITQMRRMFADREFPLAIYSDVILDEMSTFEQEEGGRKLEAARGYHDDCVMAVAMAIEGESTMPYTEDDWHFYRDDSAHRDWRSL